MLCPNCDKSFEIKRVVEVNELLRRAIPYIEGSRSELWRTEDIDEVNLLLNQINNFLAEKDTSCH